MPLLLFLALPLAEIAGFIVVGHAIGVVPTLMLIVASSTIGLALLRDAGALTVARLRAGIGKPQAVLAQGGTRMLAGFLLLIPGFLTDLAALILLIPGVPGLMFGRFTAGAAAKPAPPQVIEGDFRRIDP